MMGVVLRHVVDTTPASKDSSTGMRSKPEPDAKAVRDLGRGRHDNLKVNAATEEEREKRDLVIELYM